MIVRKHKTKGNFTQIDNDLLRNRQLSLSAKGLLSYMLSCKDDWYFSAQKLQEETNSKRNVIETILKELESKKYIKIKKEKGKDGRFKVEFTIYEEPLQEKSLHEQLKEIDESLLPF